MTELHSAKPESTIQTQARPNPIETDSVQNWLLILQNLDAIRVDAIIHRDKSVLENVYSENSPLKITDLSLIQNLIRSEMTISGLSFQISDLSLISHRWSNDEEVVELKITSKRSAYEVFQKGKLIQKVHPSEGDWLISLTKVGDYWHIGNAELDLDNR